MESIAVAICFYSNLCPFISLSFDLQDQGDYFARKGSFFVQIAMVLSQVKGNGIVLCLLGGIWLMYWSDIVPVEQISLDRLIFPIAQLISSCWPIRGAVAE